MNPLCMAPRSLVFIPCHHFQMAENHPYRPYPYRYAQGAHWIMDGIHVKRPDFGYPFLKISSSHWFPYFFGNLWQSHTSNQIQDDPRVG